MDRAKRKRGGQPGNRNALKNGVYSLRINNDRRRKLKQAAGLDEINRHITTVRHKARVLINSKPFDESATARALTAMAGLMLYRNKLNRMYRRSVFILNAASSLADMDFTIDPASRK